jgi:rRNA processing protein Gar1
MGLNVCILNVDAPQFIKQILLNIKGQIGPVIIVVGDLNTPFSSIARTLRQNIKKKS